MELFDTPSLWVLHFGHLQERQATRHLTVQAWSRNKGQLYIGAIPSFKPRVMVKPRAFWAHIR
jgi:hypothetical protein